VISLSPGQVIDPGHPALMFISQNVGQAVPALSLSWRILDLSSDDKEATPVELVAPTAVDLANDLITFDPQNACAGFYAPRWTVPSETPAGRYAIEWTYELAVPTDASFTTITTESSPAGTVRKVFEVVATPGMGTGKQALYSLLRDARDFLGATTFDVSDAKLRKVIARASNLIERVTGRVFEPRFAYRRLGGNSSRKLLLGEPIIAISSVGIDTQPTQTGDLTVELDLLRIYNRHLSEGLIDPDDREDPMIEFVHSDDLYGIRFVPFRGISLRSLAWPTGVQNIHVRGLFGYTEPDGSPWGETPELIQHATRLIVARELPKFGSDEREDAQWRWRITSEKARDVEIQMAPLPTFGGWTGDSEVDGILASFTRPPRLAST
jgi:hypothetical protein